jgi:hypothetical protein|tara:strand:- start:4874 stop:5128 length:255 start_codon:yes stop_codon:yes gene_type:complete
MDMLILLDGEFRSLIRNSLERIISTRFKKDDNKYKEILKKLSIRVVSSLIAIQLFLFIQNNISDMKKYVSFIMIIIFLNLIIEN